MDRTRSRGSQHRRAMRTDGYLAGRPVLHTGAGKRGKPEADALAGRAVHAHAVLRSASDDVLAKSARLRGQWEAGATAATGDGAGSDLSQASVIPARPRTSNLSLSPAGVKDRATEPGVGERYYVYTSTPRVYLSGGDPGLVQSIRSGLGRVGIVRERLLLGGAGVGLADGMPGHFQYGSRGAIHERGLHAAVGEERHHDQHGWAGTSAGQYFCGATVAQCEVRRGVSPRLRAGGGGGEEFGRLFSVLQSRASASGLGLSDASSDVLRKSEMHLLRKSKTGDAGGRGRWEASLLDVPDANFFSRKPAWSENPSRTVSGECLSQTQASPGMGVREGAQTPPLPLRPHPGFKCRAGKMNSSCQISRQRSTLKRPNFCLKDGEHLTTPECMECATRMQRTSESGRLKK